MTASGKRIAIALAISTTVTLFNIVAVSSGLADTYYVQIETLFDSSGLECSLIIPG